MTIGQMAVDGKESDIIAVRTLLSPIDLNDALHCPGKIA
jgi:hypothetical protein